MSKLTEKFEWICTKIVFLIAVLMFAALSFWAVKYSHRYAADYSSEKIWGTFDSAGKNFLFFLVVMAVLYILQLFLIKGNEEKQRRRVKIFWIVDMILVGILGIVWVTGSHIMPYADQMQVYLTALDFSDGIYTDMGAYFYMYRQQYGLAFLYECVLWIWESYHLIQYINVLFLVLILCFGYLLTDELFKSPRANFYTILAMNLFLPLFLYINFVYGEVGIVAMSLCAVWAVVKWMNTGKHRYAVLAAVAMTLALMARKNMLIVAIALAIILLFFALVKKNWKACVLAALLFVVPLGSIRLVEWSYELRSGNEVGDGMPAVLHIAMGMQESWNGAGAYNAYNNSTFWGAAGGDSELASQIGWADIKARVQEFKANPAMARYFYQSKIWEQWDEGSFGSLIMTARFEAAPFAPAQELYGGKWLEPAMDWMEYYLFVIYVSALFYSLYGLWRIRELKGTVLPMIVIGGLIFSLLWEAKARYVFPYVAMLLPAVAAGWHVLHLFLDKIIGKIIKLN